MKKSFPILLILSCAIVFFAFHIKWVESENIEVRNVLENPLNIEQHAASIKMGVSDHQIYFLINKDLLLLNNLHLQKTTTIDAPIIALDGDHIYYMVITPEYVCDVYCYSIPNCTRTYLFTTADLINARDCYLQDGNVYIPYDRRCSQFFSFDGIQVGDIDAKNKKWEILGDSYGFAYENDRQEFVCYRHDDAMKSPEEVLPYGLKTVVECDNGILIHNESQGNLLYFLERDTGKIVELFTVECMSSISAVNVYRTNVYISFCRYKNHGQLGMVGYEGDTLEGTYRIDLSDYSVEKINNNVYSGLYIFDDTGIYACDSECNVYKLDFEGKVILKFQKFR